ncbi:hypothetical protein AB0I66_38885 [Streptomyces sp. NPDC050439]|uniref:hypothetical protein n=1 Tax=unclassified Streptomyces TaxID=2593676 RepID=UPI003421F0EC
MDSHLRGFEARVGYPPDCNTVAPARKLEEPERREPEESERLEIAAASGELALLYCHLSHLSLPDVGPGLFVHSAQQTVAGLRGDLPTRIEGAVDHALGTPVVVFGSDGGGALFALSRADGATVYRLPVGRVDGQTYRPAPSTSTPTEVLAPNLRAFLTYVEGQLRQQT